MQVLFEKIDHAKYQDRNALKPSCDALFQYDPKIGHIAVMQHRNHIAIGAVAS